MNNVYNEIKEEDLTPDLKMISDICGIDTVRILLKHFGGLTFYIPKLTRLDDFIRRYIKMYRDKSNKLIAKELGVSEQYIRKFL